MIYKKVRQLINEFRTRNHELHRQNAELMWADVFHDTIKGQQCFQNLSLSPGRYAAGYSFLYVLTRILLDHEPKRIIEFGLGESSKLISAYLGYKNSDAEHLIIEQDEEWGSVFLKKFKLCEQSELLYLPLCINKIKGNEVYSYSKLLEKVSGIYDLYIVDGPTGSMKFSRYDIYLLAERLKPGDEFIILTDDTERQGEQDTVEELKDLFAKKGFHITIGRYGGIKSQTIISSARYTNVSSL